MFLHVINSGLFDGIISSFIMTFHIDKRVNGENGYNG